MSTWDGVTVAGTPPRVTQLNFHRKRLTGTIPPALGSLSNLIKLELHHNDLTGPIPATWGTDTHPLPNLETLDLHVNQLTGPIPPALGSLSNLTELALHQNRLTGTIPPALGALSNLETLALNHNQLTGTIPEVLGTLSSLVDLWLHENQLDGPIPAAWGSATHPLSELQSLRLDNNQLSGNFGPIPVGTAGLRNLVELRLDNNALSGAIPAAWGTLSTLNLLRLTATDWTGTIPQALLDRQTADTLTLRTNRRPVPPSIADQTPLVGAPFAYSMAFSDPDGDTLHYLATQADGSTLPTWLAYDGTTGLLSGTPSTTGEEVTVTVTATDGDPLAANDLPCDPFAGVGDEAGLCAAVTLTLTVTAATADATLSALTLADAGGNAIALSPAFAASTALYTAAVINSVMRVTVTATTSDAAASVAYLDGSSMPLPDADGTAENFQVNLTEGANTITVQVTNGTTTQSYTLTITRAGDGGTVSMDATLSALTLTDAGSTAISLSPTFAAGTTSYTAAVAHSVARVTVVATTSDATASVAYLDGSSMPLPDADGTAENFQVNLSVGATTITVKVTAEDTTTARTYELTITRAAGRGGTGSGGTSGGSAGGSGGTSGGSAGGSGGGGTGGGSGRGTGGGRGSGGDGGSNSPRDQHGNTPAQATGVALGATAPWFSATAGQLNTPTDVDYFALTLPHAGVLVVETTGAADTVGRVWQDGEELARADSGGAGRNFWLSTPVAAGPVLIAVTGTGTSAYTLVTRLLVGFLENPAPDSFQSGLGLLSGWVCEAEVVELEINGGPRITAAYGTVRADTAETEEGAELCGDTANGFGLLFNWNLLGDGTHTVRAVADGVAFDQATFTVTTLGQEFVAGAAGTCAVPAFPSPAETVTLVWQEAQQNFVLTDGNTPPVGAPPLTGAPVGVLENPAPNSFQSGIGVISGWVCEAEAVTIEVEIAGVSHHLATAYGTERADTAIACGDTDNGFGLLFNWNLLGDGTHTLVTLVDGAPWRQATVRVTTLGEEFVAGVAGECVVEDFPSSGEAVLLEWQEAQQNFVLTHVE